MLRHYRCWRPLFWGGGSLVALISLTIALIGFLLPPPQLLQPSPAYGRLYRGNEQIATVTLSWRGDRDRYWEGRLSSFPVGTTAYFHPGTAPGFFVVHLPDGKLLALTDRSNHRGQRVYWYDPLRYWGVAGFIDHDYGSAYRADGERYVAPLATPLTGITLQSSMIACGLPGTPTAQCQRYHGRRGADEYWRYMDC